MTDTAPRPRFACAVEATLHLVGGRWKSLLLYHLGGGTRRFNELGRLVPGATRRMLTLQLRELERDGFVRRLVHPVVPPHVDYSLTDKGRSLLPVLDVMAAWGEEHMRDWVDRPAEGKMEFPTSR